MREDVNDDACFGRPSTSTTDENIEAVKKIILNNRRITMRLAYRYIYIYIYIYIYNDMYEVVSIL